MNNRKLVVSRGNLELGSVFPDSPLVLIGRSPACDLVLGVGGLQSVHFLLEWAGEGEFNPETGVWVLTEVERASHLNEKQAAESSHNRGVVLGAKTVHFGGLSWKWTKDSFSRGELPTGLLRKQVQASAKAVSRDFLGQSCLEVIRLSQDGEVVIDVEHLVRGDYRASKILPTEKGLKLRWRKEMPSLEWGNLKATAMNARAQPLTSSKKFLAPADLLYLEGHESCYYFRLVPRLEILESPYEILTDGFLRFAAGSFAFMLIVLYFIHGSGSHPEEVEIEKKPRIATVEIKQALPPVVQQPKVETPPPVVQPEPPAVSIKPRPIKPKIKAPRMKTVAPPKPAPVAVNVNNVGLLGSMKKSNPANTSVVSAESIASKPNNSVTGDEGKVLVTQASGMVDTHKLAAKTNDKDVLKEATNNFSVKDNFVAGKVATESNRFSGAAFSIDASDEEGSEESSASHGESVHGGLSREAVGHAVFAQRQKIKACYQTALVANPQLNGRVTYKWQISATGSVTSIQMVSSEVHQPSLESCVMSVLRSTVFPSNLNNESSKVLYPFVFKPRG